MNICKPADKTGRIHSFESFGTQEGPGIRYVVFMQGCLARCRYCQNPDTWKLNAGRLMSPEQVFKKIHKCLPYMRSSGGGVTISGGEPLLQLNFLLALFKLCKKHAIHTAIDTSGFFELEKNKGVLEKLIKLTDLFIVDIKALEEKPHKNISFISLLEGKKRPYWVRYVLIPGLNDSKKDMAGLKRVLSRFRHMEKFEFLGYHRLGRHKWRHLGLKYTLDRFAPATARDITRAQDLLNH